VSSLRRAAYLAIGLTLTNGWVHRVHRWLYARVGARGPIGRALGVQMGVLTTTGRRSGRAQPAPLVVVPADRGWIVVGSNGGRDRMPAWVTNLRVDARGVLELAGNRMHVLAREPDGDERAKLWNVAVAAYPGFAVYRERTSRDIPLVMLEPMPADPDASTTQPVAPGDGA
jgi:deazaflavin-dependent oxidoreductase (nitroreductase family)